ncbi:hypothetical protein BGZ54_002197 [Gamsiella multidivaricata]|nr:hypothetical protein BGZ54_002197 [Gamsiella multidivaricata]
MSNTITPDVTPHPLHGIARQPLNADGDDSNLGAAPTSKPAVTMIPSTSLPGGRSHPSVFGHHTALYSQDVGDISGDSETDSDDNSEEGYEHVGRKPGRRRRRRRISASASHLLAQAPTVPDLRFDHNYRKALDQIYETHARESAQAAEFNAAATGTSSSSSRNRRQQRQVRTVPSITARVTVMTLRDIILMPFIHGFFWGFGTVLLTLVGQRSLFYHAHRTWRKIFGGNPDDVSTVVRGEPARVRRVGTTVGGGLGLMNAGSAANQPAAGFARPSAHVY